MKDELLEALCGMLILLKCAELFLLTYIGWLLMRIARAVG